MGFSLEHGSLGDGSPHIRHAVRSDRDALIRLHRALYVDYRNHIGNASLRPLVAYRDFASVLVDDVDAMMNSRNTEIFVAELRSVLIGYVTGRTEHDPRREISKKGVVEDWFVAPTHRGHGVGRALFANLAKRFAERGCGLIESTTWSFNRAGRAAHERLGFKEIQVMYRMPLNLTYPTQT